MGTLYFGGPILTMDKAYPRAEALLVDEGRVAMVGTLSELKPYAADAEHKDLEGKTLMPAFVDGHGHMAGMGLFGQRCDLIGCTSFDDLLDRIRKFKAQRGLTHGEVIRCRGYDPSLMKEQAHPNAALLDSLGFENPIVCVHQSGHMLACNTAAMKLCGVDDSYEFLPGGHAERNAEGHLTGFFEERAQYPFKIMDKFTDSQIEDAILEAQEYYFSRGITTIQDGSGIGEKRLACFERLADTGKLKADVVVYISPNPDDPSYWSRVLSRRGNREYKGHLKVGGIKLMLDGSPQARTAWMRQPYEGETEYCGYPILTDDKVYQILCNAIDAELQPLAHCNGDAACEQFLSCWERAVADKGKGTGLRPVMIHAQTVGYDQLDRMGPVGMMPSFFVGHCFFWGDTHLKNFGERGQRISPVKAAMDRGLPYSFHQDSPVTRPEMLHTAWCAVNRVTRSGVCVGVDNRIGVYDALIGVTRGGAYGYFEEETKGVLRKGAVADLVILDRDPCEVPVVEVCDVQVFCTVKEGEIVFCKED